MRWKRGPFELGAGLATSYRKITITPPALGDLTSFNYFRNTIQQRANADSLMLPDSVVYNQSEERRWEAGGGLAMRLPGDRGSWGVEYHRLQGLTEQTLSGEGPLWKGWDLRTGLEYRCTQALTGRVGYMYRWEDRGRLHRAERVPRSHDDPGTRTAACRGLLDPGGRLRSRVAAG